MLNSWRAWRAWGAGIHTGHTGTRITQTSLVARVGSRDTHGTHGHTDHTDEPRWPLPNLLSHQHPRAERTSSCDGGGLLASVADIERFSTGSAGAGAPAGSGDDASCASGWSAWM